MIREGFTIMDLFGRKNQGRVNPFARQVRIMRFSDDDLNLLYDASLEFGAHYNRPLIEWTREFWPDRNEETRDNISRRIATVRAEINNYISDQYDYKAGKLTVSEKQVKNWIKQHYPWMTPENIAHGYSQGMYFALRG
jgi:hypothetical protein